MKDSKVINLFNEEEVQPIPYNKALDESDYAIWKARQQANSNVVVLKGGER